jgi:O-antigen ligase
MQHSSGFIGRLFPHLHGEDVLNRVLLLVVACLFALVLPVLMVFSTRSSAALLVIAAVLLCLVEYRTGRRMPGGFAWRPLLLWEKGQFPFFLLWCGFALLAFISIIHTQNPAFHTRRLVEFLLPVFAGGAVIAILRHRKLPVSTLLLAIGLVLAGTISLLELYFGAPFRPLFGLKPEAFRLNRTMVTFALLLFPLVALALAEKRLWLAFMAAFVPVLVIVGSESGAALFGLLVGLGGYMLAKLARKAVGLVFMASSTLIWLLAPWHGAMLARLIPASIHERLVSTASSIRVEIYRAFGYAAEAAPLLGAGFNTAAQPLGEPAYEAVPRVMQHYILYGHPHNAALQVWVELGLVGILFAIALTLGALRMIARLPVRVQPLWYGFFAACFAISIISHGAWQAWWAGNIAICLAIMMMATRIHALPDGRTGVSHG